MSRIGRSISATLGWIVLLLVAAVAFAQDAASFVKSGNAKRARGDLDGAIADFTRAIEIDPKDAFAYDARGSARQAKRDLDGAIADFSIAIQLEPRYANAYFNRGVARRAKGDFDGAIADFSRAVDVNPRYAFAYFERGEVKRTRGDLDGAVSDFSRAIDCEPRYAGAYYFRGIARQASGDLDGAVSDWTRTIEIEPRHAGAYCCRGLVTAAKGDPEGGIAECSKAIEIEPRYAAAYFGRGRLRASWYGASSDALADLRKGVEVDATGGDFARLWIWIVRAGLGDERPAGDELRAYVLTRPAAKGNDWYSMLAGLLTGRVSETELLRLALSADRRQNDEQACRAFFYAGALRAMHRERTAAIDLFDQCLATGVKHFSEYDGAMAWRAALAAGARVCSPPAEVRDFLGLRDGGLWVEDVDPDGPAARAGLKAKDVVRSVNGKETSPDSWRRMLCVAANGSVVKLRVVHAGKAMDVELRLGRWE